MRAADSMRATGTEPFELRKGRAGSYKSMKVINAATATGHSPESLEGRVEAWRSVDAATGRPEKVNIPGPSNRES